MPAVPGQGTLGGTGSRAWLLTARVLQGVLAGIMLLGLVITLIAIRVKREDLAGVNPMAAPTD